MCYHLDKCISDNFPFLLRVGCHIQCLANALPGCPVLLRDGKCCCSIVEGVSSIYHWREQHFRGEKENPRIQSWVHTTGLQLAAVKRGTGTGKHHAVWPWC